MLFNIILLVLLIRPIIAAPFSTTTTSPDTSDESEDLSDSADDPIVDEACRRALASELFSGHLSREQTKATLLRALDLLANPKRPLKPTARGPNYDEKAKNLLRFMTGEPNIGSTSNSSSLASPVKKKGKQSSDSDYEGEGCTVPNRQRPVSRETMLKIINADANGVSEQSIRGQYRWYRKQYLQRFYQCLQQGGTTRNKMLTINEHVWSMVQETRAAHRVLHDHMIRRWAIQRATEIGARSFFTASPTGY